MKTTSSSSVFQLAGVPESSTSVLSNALALPDLSSSHAAILEDGEQLVQFERLHTTPMKRYSDVGVGFVLDVSVGTIAVTARRYDAVVTTLLCNSPASFNNTVMN